MAIVCAGAVAGAIWFRARPIGMAAQLTRLPKQNAVMLHVDFDALRRTGILELLAGSKAEQDIDYQRFVVDTGFDYQRDLDKALIAFAPSGNYMLVSGRFDWKKIHDYATGHGGQCQNAICQVPGSTPERRISFLPLQSGLMALAVSTDPKAVYALLEKNEGSLPEIPPVPLWLGMSGSVLRSDQELPSGTRMFARAMDQADYVSISLAQGEPGAAAKLDVTCRDAAAASQIAAELTRITAMLREMIEREAQKANPADLSGVLTSGTFRAEGTHVTGIWPIDRSFLRNILTGGVS